MVEVLIVIVVAGILTGMAYPGVARYISQQNATNARNSFAYMAARARSAAIERGSVARLTIDAAGDSAIVVTAGGDVLERMNYAIEYQVDVSSSGEPILDICYTSRGFAVQGSPACSANDLDAVTDLTFTRANRSSSARVRLAGQVVAR